LIIIITKNIGPYEIISKVKDGGYSKIYLIKLKYTGDNVCIKIIEKIFFQESVEDLLLAARQIKTLKILKHRNILSLLEIYEFPYLFFYLQNICLEKI
jgi:serine/threonine protein kinase